MITRPVRSGRAVALAVAQGLVFGLWSTTGCSLEADQEAGDPATVFASAQKAVADGDYSGLVSFIAPSERPLVALAIEALVHVLIEHEQIESAAEAKVRYELLHRQYGVSLEPYAELPTLEEIDNRLPHLPQLAAKAYPVGLSFAAYLPELLTLQARLQSRLPGFEDDPAVAVLLGILGEETLEGLRIDGDAAWGTASGRKITFVREDGRWHLTAASILGAP